MTKFANVKSAPKTIVAAKPPKGVVKTRSKSAPDTVTFEGADGFTRKAKSELFLLSVTNMVGEDSFYEKAEDRDARFESLIHEVVAKDPEWVARFVPYLRNQLFMRTASLVMAAEYVKGGGPNGRKVVDAAIQRADEPSVLIAYWMSHYGRKIPQPIKRGVADAAVRLYSEKSFIKYDSDSISPRFGDVVELVHPKGSAAWQHDLFRYAMAKRHNREDLARDMENLSTIKRFRDLMALPVDERRALVNKASETGDFSGLEGAGLTWENLSGWLQGPMDKAAWEAILPQMGAMALIRNLRNFDDAGISPEARAKVVAKLTSAEDIAASKMLPMRFYVAHKNVTSANWISALETGLDLTLQNVPALPGRTLILVDTSGSMDNAYSGGNKRTFQHSGAAKTSQLWEVAALFGSALALRAEKADLAYFQSDSGNIDFRKGDSVLRTIEKFQRHVGGGTDGHGALARHFKGHDRVVYVTDEQFHPGTRVVTGVNTYVFNLAGYRAAAFSSADRTYSFGGLSDKAFAAIVALENHKDGEWPF